MSPLLSLSFEARIECSRWCSSHFSSSREQQQFCSFPSRRVAFRTTRSIHHRRDDVNAGKTTHSAGKNQLQNPLLGAVNVVFKTRAKGAASRATGRNGASWKSSWTRAPSRAFARYVCVVCARFTRRLVSLSLSLCVCDTNM